jgi:molybdopterin-binding protein
MNEVIGTITGVETDEELVLVTMESVGHTFSALLVGENTALDAGERVVMTFREMETSIGKDLEGGLSLRNRFECVITAIEEGLLLTKVTLDFNGTGLVSVITTGSAKRLQLQTGDQVEALVKTTDMSLTKTGD